MPFEYKRILVVGATSGIGRALADRFIAEGSFIIGAGRRQDRLDEFVAAHGKDKADSVQFDVSDLEAIPQMVAEVTEKYPDLDLVFLNAGIQRPHWFNKPESIDLAVIEEEMKVNYTAQVAFTQHVLPFLIEKSTADKKRALLYTTSNLAIVPAVRCPNYCASKAALHAMILCLRAQLEQTNVRVLELLPPAVQTELHDEKFQPDIKNGRKLGMPLAVFTEEAYAGLAAGKEQVLVGAEMFGNVAEVEESRQKMFWNFWKRMKPEK